MPRRRAEDAMHVVMTDHRIQRGPSPHDPAHPLEERHAPAQDKPVPYRTPDLSPAERDLYVGLALLERGGEAAQARRRLEAAVGRLGGQVPPEVSLALARVMAAAGDRAAALKEFRAVLGGESERGWAGRRPTPLSAARTTFADVLAQAGDHRRAETEFRRVLATAPLPEAHLGLARVLIETGREAAAVPHLEAAARSARTRATALSNLGNLHTNAGRLAEAYRALTDALRFDPDLAEAHNNLGRVLATQTDVTGALAALERAVRLDAAYAEARYNRGRLRHALSDCDDARRDYEEAIRLRPDLPDAHVSLGVMLAEEGRLPAAIRAFQQALRLRPDHAEVRRLPRLAKQDAVVHRRERLGTPSLRQPQGAR